MGRMLCTGLGCLAFSIGLGALGVVCLGTGGSGADDDGGGCQADSVLLLFLPRKVGLFENLRMLFMMRMFLESRQHRSITCLQKRFFLMSSDLVPLVKVRRVMN